MRQLDDLYASLSAVTGTSPDQLKLLSTLLFSVPLAAGLPKLPASSNLTHVSSIAVSYIFLTQLLHLQRGFEALLGQSIGTWLAVWYCRRNRKSKPWFWAIFMGNMAVLTINHFARWVSNTPLEIVEITGSQMVLVMKLSLFAWAAYDGQRPSEELDPIQKRDRIAVLPGLLPFLGYCFFFPSVMVGPTFTYASYEKFVDRSLFASVKGKETEIKMPPGRYRKAFKRLGIGAIYLTIYAVFGARYSYEQLLVPKPEWNIFLWRILFVQIAGFMARTKYYAVWSFAEGGMIVSGLGYDPETGKWNRGRNVMIRQIETAQSFKTLLDAWNCGTNYWLRECVYKRLAKKGKKPGFKSTMVTFATSAFWHGFNPTYYMTFVLAGFVQALGRTIRTSCRPFFLPANYELLSLEEKQAAENTITKKFYDLLSIVAVQLALNFTVIPFMLLDITPTLRAWKMVGFYGIFLCFVPMAFFQFGGRKMLKTAQRARAEKAGVSQQAVDQQRIAAKKRSAGVNIVPELDSDDLKERTEAKVKL